MVVETVAQTIVVNTISGIITNLPWFILIVWGFKIIAKELREGIKNIPSWLSQYEKMKEKERLINHARGIKHG